jgi:F-type H+-transporting ATPase subunit epsilon
MAGLKLEIVTPESVTFSDEVDSVVVPGEEGELGVLPQHVPVMAKIQPGELRYSKGGEGEKFLAVGNGFVEILPSRVSILTDMALYEEDIDVAEAEAAVERAKKALEEATDTDADQQAQLEAVMMRNLAAIELKRRRRG